MNKERIDASKIRYRDAYDDYDDSEYNTRKKSLSTIILNILLIIAVFIIGYVAAYNPVFEDTIKEIKNNYITMQLMSISITTALIVILSLLPLKKENKVKVLIILTIINIIVIACLLVVKLKLDKTYTQNTFEKIYIVNDIQSLSVKAMEAQDAKKLYVDEQMTLYSFFNLKVLTFFALQLCVFGINAYRILKKKNEIEKAGEKNG